jgi:hypothetical protein
MHDSGRAFSQLRQKFSIFSESRERGLLPARRDDRIRRGSNAMRDVTVTPENLEISEGNRRPLGRFRPPSNTRKSAGPR